LLAQLTTTFNAEHDRALLGHFTHLSLTTEYPSKQSVALSKALVHALALSAVHF